METRPSRPGGGGLEVTLETLSLATASCSLSNACGEREFISRRLKDAFLINVMSTNY